MTKLPLIVQPTGGLCNRMRTIAAAAELASILGCRMCVIWTRDVSLNARFDSLFQPLPFPVVEFRLGSFLQRLLWHFCRYILRYRVFDDAWIYANARGKDLSLWRGDMERQPVYICASCDIFKDGGDYSMFRLAEALKPRTLSNPDDVVGIHIRRTDNVKSVRYSPTSLFTEKIAEVLSENPAVRFYLATDDATEETTLQQRFPGKIIIYKKESLDRNSPVAIRDAVIDLYNLAHCGKIYGSFWSSFSDIAALWGGIEKEVLKTDGAGMQISSS